MDENEFVPGWYTLYNKNGFLLVVKRLNVSAAECRGRF